MRRRDFIAVIGGSIAWPLESRAQQGEKVYRVGILDTTSATQNAAHLGDEFGVGPDMRCIGAVG